MLPGVNNEHDCLRMTALYTKTYEAQKTAFSYLMILTDWPIEKEMRMCFIRKKYSVLGQKIKISTV